MIEERTDNLILEIEALISLAKTKKDAASDNDIDFWLDHITTLLYTIRAIVDTYID